MTPTQTIAEINRLGWTFESSTYRTNRHRVLRGDESSPWFMGTPKQCAGPLLEWIGARWLEWRNHMTTEGLEQHIESLKGQSPDRLAHIFVRDLLPLFEELLELRQRTRWLPPSPGTVPAEPVK